MTSLAEVMNAMDLVQGWPKEQVCAVLLYRRPNKAEAAEERAEVSLGGEEGGGRSGLVTH